MKQCPTCQKTFDDAMRFCQTDGTPLIEMSGTETDDPYKTTIGQKEDLTPATPLDPFKTMVGSSPQFPEDQDSLKTMFISDEEMKREMSGIDEKQEAIIEIPPLTSGSASADKNDSAFDSSSATNFNDSGLSAPSFGDMGSGSAESSTIGETSNPYGDSSSYDQKTSGDESNSPFDSSPFNQPSPPIPSPFNDAKPASFDAPSTPLPTYKETEPLSYDQTNPFSGSPFDQSSMPVNQPLQQTEWTPPPAPQANWQNQEIGANSPFQPPGASAGQNQTLAIVSLVLGVLSIPCCSFIVLGIGAAVTGFIAKNKADQNPELYGGRGMALAGMIMGIISIVIGLIVWILQIILGGLNNLGNY